MKHLRDLQVRHSTALTQACDFRSVSHCFFEPGEDNGFEWYSATLCRNYVMASKSGRDWEKAFREEKSTYHLCTAAREGHTY